MQGLGRKQRNLFHGSEDTFPRFPLKFLWLLKVRFFRTVFVIVDISTQTVGNVRAIRGTIMLAREKKKKLSLFLE